MTSEVSNVPIRVMTMVMDPGTRAQRLLAALLYQKAGSVDRGGRASMPSPAASAACQAATTPRV